MDELLSGFPVVVELPVAWGEMDAFQHVNNASYFRYFETARIAYFEKIGLIELLREKGIGPILASTSCRYKLPLTYPDTVAVGAKSVIINEDRFTMQYLIVSRRHHKIAAEGDGVIVMYDYRNSRKTELPEALKKEITRLENSICSPAAPPPL